MMAFNRREVRSASSPRMPKHKQSPPAEKSPSNQHGGARANAGRPEVYSFKEKIALQLRIAELRKFYGCSGKSAENLMRIFGELPSHGVSNIGRYITPKFLNRNIATILRTAPERIGIVAAIPRPKSNRRK